MGYETTMHVVEIYDMKNLDVLYPGDIKKILKNMSVLPTFMRDRLQKIKTNEDRTAFLKSLRCKTGSEIAHLDLCKCGHTGPLPDLLVEGINAIKDDEECSVLYCLWASDGGTKILSDSYGDPIVCHDIIPFLDALKESEKTEGYRRFRIAIALLESVKEDFSGNIKVLTYGH